jgi:hypothetical protein
MKRVLVADREPLLVSAIVRGLEQRGLEADGCTSESELERRLLGRTHDLAVLDASFVAVHEAQSAPARVVLTFTFMNAASERELLRSFTVLRKPFTCVELWNVMQDELGWSASPAVSLVGMLARAYRDRTSLSIEVSDLGTSATIYVSKGEIVHATSGHLEGEDALLAILKGPTRFYARAAEPVPGRSIVRRFPRLVPPCSVASSSTSDSAAR